jgi:hypothetical protein
VGESILPFFAFTNPTLAQMEERWMAYGLKESASSEVHDCYCQADDPFE